MTTAIIDYGSGNLHSARKAFERAAIDAGITADVIVTGDADKVARAERIVLPGVGAFRDCKQGLFAVPGMVDALCDGVITKAKPFLGICVGMQLMATRGLEFGAEDGLGWIPGEVRRIEPADTALKIPHMGWNTLEQTRPHCVLEDIATGADGLHAYFVHSYGLLPARQDHVVAVADYACTIAAMVGRDNMIGTQFHPEKSQKLGLSLIANFLRWRP